MHAAAPRRPQPKSSLLLGALICLALASIGAQAASRIVHQERSLYQNILVQEDDDRRCLLFNRRGSARNQSCIYLEDQDRLVFPYTRMMLAGLLLRPEPERIMIAGLGGGSLPRLFADLYPNAEQDLIEIDPAVVRVARRYFEFRPTERMTVHERDARVFVKRAIASGRKWDLILLDAFTGDYIPEHLMTREFLEEVRSVLAPGGVVIANTFSTSALYDYESATYAAAFPHVAELTLPISLNRILIASEQPLPDAEALQARAAELAGPLRPYGVEIEEIAGAIGPDFEWNRNVRVLTDQYSPANLLR